MTKIRTDYAEREVYKKRARAGIKRGDRLVKKTRIRPIRFNENFETFAANVAYELRDAIVYRSDGGRFARGLVRASQQLWDIHKAHKHAKLPPHEIKLEYILFRREHGLNTGRWVMMIHFNDPNWIDMSGDMVIPGDAFKKSREEDSFEEVLAQAHLAMAGDATPQGARIRKLLALVDRLPYQKAKSLWYYDAWEIQAFLNAGKEKRKEMWERKDWKRWRRYPFASWNTYSIRGGITNQTLKASLLESDKWAFKGKEWLQKRKTSGSNIENDYFHAFFDHFVKLVADRQHLYSVYKAK